jgi:hypothetical protein
VTRKKKKKETMLVSSKTSFRTLTSGEAIMRRRKRSE